MPIERSNLGGPLAASASSRPISQAIWRGFRRRCPNCGAGPLFGSYLEVNERCPRCNEELHHHRADDAPPYFVILIAGHLVVGSALAVEVAFAPPMWLQMLVWPLLAVVLCLFLLPRVKGALVGLQFALRMHGFDTAARKTGKPFIDDGPRYKAPVDGRTI